MRMKLTKPVRQIQRVRFTKEGYEKLQQEYEALQKERPDAVAHLKKAREMGDLSENGYYKASRAKLSSIDARLFRMSMQLKYALIVDSTKAQGVDIGCKVTLKNDKREISYDIVGDLEADPSEGKLSLLSPIGKAVAHKNVGDEIEVEVPAGKIRYTITEVQW